MLHRVAFYVLIGATLSLAPLPTVAGDLDLSGSYDWPHWRGPTRDGKVNGFLAPQSWPIKLEQKWKTTVGLGDATPALVGHRLFVFARQGGDEVLLCLNAQDGKELWRNQYAAQKVTGAAATYQGPRSSPAVAGGRVVTLGVGGVLSCLETDTGTVLWRNFDFTNAVPMFFTAMSPLLVDGMCIAHLGGKDKGTLVVIEMVTGRQKWRWVGAGPAYASPAMMKMGENRHIVLQTESHLMGLSLADGNPLWKVPTRCEPGYWNSVTPVVDGSTIIYSGQGTGTKAVQIIQEGAGFTAQELWSNQKLGTVYTTPVIKDGRLYALSDRGRFFCLNARTGTTLWTSTNRVSNFGAMVDAGSVLVALPEKSGLIFLRPSEQGYQELARIKVSETPIYAHPVLAGRSVFVRDAQTVARWEQVP